MSKAEVQLPLFRTAYDLGPRLPVYDTTPEGLSLTKQAFANECDINEIMARAQAGMAVDHFNPAPPQFGDFVNVDYQESLNIVLDAQESFAQLPAKIRSRFNNDPASLLAFLSDETNRPEAVALGLINPPPVEAPPGSVPDPGSTSQNASTKASS